MSTPERWSGITRRRRTITPRLGLGADAVLVDGDFRGSGPRKMVLTASRNGYYFTLDRRTGEHMITSTFSDTVNWAKGLNAKGQPIREPAKDHHIAGALVSAANGGATNWPPRPTALIPDCCTCRRRNLRDVLPDRNRSARRDGARRQG